MRDRETIRYLPNVATFLLQDVLRAGRGDKEREGRRTEQILEFRGTRATVATGLGATAPNQCQVIAIMELQLQSCVIRPWSLSDAAAVQRYANNRKIWLNLRDVFPHPYTLDHARTFLGYVTNEKPATTFAIADPSEAIGCIGLQIGRDVHRKTAELGYWLGEPFWGRGIMTEAVEILTRSAFGVFNLERIYAVPFANNPASARVLEKAGFVFEGRLRASVFKDNQRLDSLLYARVREDA
jgi:RimJ/RimL family protein N-acetyltransferase